MPNRICRLEVRDRLVDPAAPEVWIQVIPERQTSTTEVHGRLLGPRCVYASTVEVAYPLRPWARPPREDGLCRRVIIPEASWWEPDCPFLYEGPVELWEAGECCERVTVRHGLRALTLGGRGLRLNGKRITIRGVRRNHCAEEEARTLHAQGINAFCTDVSRATADLWDRAARLGFLMLGRVAADREAIAQATTLRGFPSCLGWLLDAAIFAHDDLLLAVAPLRHAVGTLVGIESDEPTPKLPQGIHFVVCPEPTLPPLPGMPPRLIALNKAPNGHREELAASPGFLGTIQP